MSDIGSERAPFRIQRYLRGIALEGVADLIETLGGSPSELMGRAQLPLQSLDNLDIYVDASRFGVLLEMAARDLGAP
ncbi:MAG: hypothetical protein QM608_17305, partial [Caulobacter sp.]